MPSISETAAMVNAASVEISDARQKVVEAKEAIDRARRCLFEAMGEGQPETLMNYMYALDNSIATADRTIGFLDGGQQSGESYIAQLYS